MDYSMLITRAFEARKNAYAPYSDFAVGAALLGENGTVYAGCNVENAAFSPGTCAERNALYAAVADGTRRFAAIAVVGGKADTDAVELCFPCGVCRQALAEFCAPEMPVVVARSPEDYTVYTLGKLLPNSFGPGNLE